MLHVSGLSNFEVSTAFATCTLEICGRGHYCSGDRIRAVRVAPWGAVRSPASLLCPGQVHVPAMAPTGTTRPAVGSTPRRRRARGWSRTKAVPGRFLALDACRPRCATSPRRQLGQVCGLVVTRGRPPRGRSHPSPTTRATLDGPHIVRPRQTPRQQPSSPCPSKLGARPSAGLRLNSGNAPDSLDEADRRKVQTWQATATTGAGDVVTIAGLAGKQDELVWLAQAAAAARVASAAGATVAPAPVVVSLRRPGGVGDGRNRRWRGSGPTQKRAGGSRHRVDLLGRCIASRAACAELTSQSSHRGGARRQDSPGLGLGGGEPCAQA